MKYIVDFEDEPFINRNGTKMYRIKGSTSVFVPSSYLYHFPKYKEDPTVNDDMRMKELKNLQPGDIIIRQSDLDCGIARQLVLYKYNTIAPEYQLISQLTGIITVSPADELYNDGWQKYWNDYEVKDFFYSLRKENNMLTKKDVLYKVSY